MSEGEPKPRNHKTPAIDPEEFAHEVEAVHAEWAKIANYYSGVNKQKFKAGENTPSKNEFNSIGKMLDSLVKPYTKMFKKPKRKQVKKPDLNKSKGFKQESFLKAPAVTFINEHARFPDAVKLEPLADLNGDAVWSIAQATQTILAYIEEKHLKDATDKTRITLDAPLGSLFRPHLDLIDRKKWSQTADGHIVISHTTIQSLLPKLFEKRIPVIPKYLNDETKRRIADRESLLGKRTESNRDAREVVRKAEKEATAKAKPAKTRKA